VHCPHDHDTGACESAALFDLVWCVPRRSLALLLCLLRVYNWGVFLSRLASVGCVGWPCEAAHALRLLSAG
jgi:hypothetical protein